MNPWHDINRKKPETFDAIVECPSGSRVKYELDKDSGLIRMDRVLYSPFHYPCEYGFVPQTLWHDGDPLDVLILGHDPLVPGCLVECRPVGKLDMEDGGDSDVKILAVPTADPRFNTIHDLTDVTPHLLDEIAHFFQVYKGLEKKTVIVGDWSPRNAALTDIQTAFHLYDQQIKGA